MGKGRKEKEENETRKSQTRQQTRQGDLRALYGALEPSERSLVTETKKLTN